MRTEVETDRETGKIEYTVHLSKVEALKLRYCLARNEAKSVIRDLRDGLCDRHEHGLRIPRKKKKRLKKMEAACIGRRYGIPANDVLKMMK